MADDVAISLAFNIRDCHAVTRDDENGTFSTGPFAGMIFWKGQMWISAAHEIYYVVGVRPRAPTGKRGDPPLAVGFLCHARAGGHPVSCSETWIPAFAGMTPVP